MSEKPAIDIGARTTPIQDRSARTVEQVLDAAADILSEVGFERLTTNAICARAGLTPPALYRYFPNKYAVLKALGERLMQRQNDVLARWVEFEFDPEKLEASMARLLVLTLEATRAQKASNWIMRTLHATPALIDVRLKSHRAVAALLGQQVRARWPESDQARVGRLMRLCVDCGYAAIEMIFDEAGADEQQVIADAARMIADTLRRAISPA